MDAKFRRQPHERPPFRLVYGRSCENSWRLEGKTAFCTKRDETLTEMPQLGLWDVGNVEASRMWIGVGSAKSRVEGGLEGSKHVSEWPEGRSNVCV